MALIISYKICSNYSNSKSYRNVTKTSMYQLMNNKGTYGEYLIYNILNDMDGKILTNLYLPKLNGGTTEIDLVFINSKGIFVIESKNYSGRIYGSLDSKYWMQILGNNQRNRFYSPILQNRTHINAIKNILKDVDEKDIYSIIVFSERCNIDNVNALFENTKVIKRNNLRATIRDIIDSNYIKFIDEEINNLYNDLLRYSIVSETQKQQHIQSIRKNI